MVTELCAITAGWWACSNPSFGAIPCSGVLPEPVAEHERESVQHAVREPSPDRLRDIFRLLAAGDTPEERANAVAEAKTTIALVG